MILDYPEFRNIKTKNPFRNVSKRVLSFVINLYFRNQQTQIHIMAFAQIIDLTLHVFICFCFKLFILSIVCN